MRDINIIAQEITAEWTNPYFGARPYIRAMHYLYRATDSYGLDSASSIIIYFLANASSWRGATARRIKKELKELIQ